MLSISNSSWRICQEKVKMQRRGRVFFNGLQTDYVAVIENKMWLIRWNVFQYLEAAAQRCSVKKVFLEILQNSQENTCARVSCLIKLQASGLKACNFIKKETGRGVCEFCEISKSTLQKPPVAASEYVT